MYLTVTRKIIGYKQEESDNLLKFLYDHIALGQDFQLRVKWAPRTVVVWDVSRIYLVTIIQAHNRDLVTDSNFDCIEQGNSALGYARLEQWPATTSGEDYSSGRAAGRDAVRSACEEGGGREERYSGGAGGC